MHDAFDRDFWQLWLSCNGHHLIEFVSLDPLVIHKNAHVANQWALSVRFAKLRDVYYFSHGLRKVALKLHSFLLTSFETMSAQNMLADLCF